MSIFEIDELCLNNPYYIVPDSEVGQQAFTVIREAIRQEGMVAIGKVVFTSREHVIALEAGGNGMLGVTLRYPYEVRKEVGIFRRYSRRKVTKDMLDLAKHIVETKKRIFQPDRFEDHYEEALKDLLKKKQSGQKIEAPREREPSKVVNLMDALRRSVETERSAAENGGSRRRDVGATIAPRRRPGVRARELRRRVSTLDNVIGWIMMTAAVLPVVLVLLLAWSGGRSRNTSSDFTPDKPRRTAAALQDAQADP